MCPFAACPRFAKNRFLGMTSSLSAAQKERLAKLEEWKKSKLESKNNGKSVAEANLKLSSSAGAKGSSLSHQPIISNKNLKKSAETANHHDSKVLKARNSDYVAAHLKPTLKSKPISKFSSNLSSKPSMQKSEKIRSVLNSAESMNKIIDSERNHEQECPKVERECKPTDNSAVKVEKIDQQHSAEIDHVSPDRVTSCVAVKMEDDEIDIKTEVESKSSLPYQILTFRDALNAAEVNQSLSRALFLALKTQEPVDKYEAQDGTIWSLTGLESSKYEYWSSWAKQEEKWMDILNAIDILNEGIDYVILQEDLVKLKEELSLLDLRFGEKYAGFFNNQHQLEDDTETDIELALKNDLPSSQYLDSHDCPNMEEDDDQPLVLLPKREPMVKQEKPGKSTMDLVNMLSEMKLEEPQIEPKKDEVKIESGLGLDSCSMSPPRKAKIAQQQKPKIGVPVADEGSTITVLTPVRAKNRLKKELGVEKVITPVRRSLRFHDEQDYVPKASSKEDIENKNSNVPGPLLDTKSKLKELLEEHEFAYIPNENVKFKMPNML